MLFIGLSLSGLRLQPFELPFTTIRAGILYALDCPSGKNADNAVLEKSTESSCRRSCVD